MVSIVGYYSNNACVLGNPYGSVSLPDDQQCDPDVSKIILLAEGKPIIAPPVDLAAIEQRIAPHVLEKLLASGNYELNEDGSVRSVYFPEIRNCQFEKGASITPLIAGEVNDIRAGTHKVNHGFTGLNECVRIEKPGFPPIYVCDNHQFAFYAWEEALAMGYIRPGARLIHIDMHGDAIGEATVWFEGKTLQEVADYTARELTADSFILPAVGRNTVGQFWVLPIEPSEISALADNAKLYMLMTNQEMREIFLKEPPHKDRLQFGATATLESLLSKRTARQSIIVDIDLDAFVSAYCFGGLLPDEKDFAVAVEFLAKIAQSADVIIIATSPWWADQRVAIPLARQIVREILDI